VKAMGFSGYLMLKRDAQVGGYVNGPELKNAQPKMYIFLELCIPEAFILWISLADF
jgi:hypothetical protein